MTDPPATGRHAQPDRDLLARVHRVFAARRPLRDDSNFFEEGFDSATLVMVLADLVELGTGGAPLALVDLYRYPTVRTLAAELGRRAQAADPGRPAAPTTLPWERLSGR